MIGTVSERTKASKSVHLSQFPIKPATASTTLKLNELPPEIFYDIVRIDSDRTASAKLRYQDLNSFSRISSSFQSPSQRLLSERVSLSTATAAREWIENGGRKYVVKELEFYSEMSTQRTK